jgi:hypothetical protein
MIHYNYKSLAKNISGHQNNFQHQAGRKVIYLFHKMSMLLEKEQFRTYPVLGDFSGSYKSTATELCKA